MNDYQKTIALNLPTLYNLYNLDKESPSYGYGDRLHWGWKVIDFNNGTLQGGVHTLALAIGDNLVDDKEHCLEIIDATIQAIPSIMRKNGSMEEAYPKEHSFCVTALVAFDVLSACQHLLEHEFISKDKAKEYTNTIKPLIGFLEKNDEEHAIISNHLATAVAAFALWNQLTNSNSLRGDEILAIIYNHQSEEGWYLEYEGPDPGYQTLCTYYLAHAYKITKSAKLLESLNKAGEFLTHFIHPDGTIGGLHGSRNTEVYYPGGMAILSKYSDVFKVISSRLSEGNHLLPQHIDIGNYIPLLNSYAVAGRHWQPLEVSEEAEVLEFNKEFPLSGLYVHSTMNYWCVINYKKGGTIKVYDRKLKRWDVEDGGVFGKLKNGKRFSTQVFQTNSSFADKSARSNYYVINDSSPSAFNFAVLRILSLTIFNSVALGNRFKNMIVKMLMTGKKALDGENVRTFEFRADSVTIKDTIKAPSNSVHCARGGKSKAIHMASSGYHLPGTPSPFRKPQVVTFLS